METLYNTISDTLCCDVKRMSDLIAYGSYPCLECSEAKLPLFTLSRDLYVGMSDAERPLLEGIR